MNYVNQAPMKLDLYSKFENRILTFVVVTLIALAFAASAVKAAEKADLALVDPLSNVWRTQSADSDGAYSACRWGIDGDVRVPADFDGDKINDLAVWRPSNGTWYILGSRDGRISQIQWGLTTPFPTGGIEDIPVPADYDGDGIADIAVWRPVDGKWYVLTSKTGFRKSISVVWGSYGDIPVPADYDGDGLTDAAVFRSWENRWYIAMSKSGELDIRTFGQSGDDLLVPADYTGDGRADLAIFRAGVWLIQDITGYETERFEFGFPDSEPAPADYDGDGITDFAVYRNGVWYIYESGKPRFRTVRFGGKKDIPLNSLSVRPSLIAVR
ncbi:MAG: FG-GAP repeat domain-containing protein [Pyrinomonadaceae bacterium]